MLGFASVATVGTVILGILNIVAESATIEQMVNSFKKHPDRWNALKELSEKSKGTHKGGLSTYTNYINKWTGSKIGIHQIVRNFKIIHGPHFHTWI